jgi:transcription antitermination factor NusG
VKQWLVTKVVPIHRIEFDVANRLEQFGCDTIVPFEMKWVKRRGRKSSDERRYALFPTYVFASFDSFGDFMKMKYAINRLAEDKGKRPPIMGAIGYGAKPANLTAEEVSWLRGITPSPTKTTALHRSLTVGGRAELVSGAFAGQVGTVVDLTKKEIRVMLRVFDAMHVVTITDMGALVAA